MRETEGMDQSLETGVDSVAAMEVGPRLRS